LLTSSAKVITVKVYNNEPFRGELEQIKIRENGIYVTQQMNLLEKKDLEWK